MDRPPARRPAEPARWLWLTLLLAPPLVAQAGTERHGPGGPILSQAATATAGGVADPEADRRVRRRLLRAQGGGVLRAESRCLDGAWQYRREGDREWTALPAGLVAAARLESDALEELRTRRAELGRAAPAGLVGLAAWALEEGLYDEALELLDGVLREDPDQPQALELLRRDDLPFGLPARAEGRPDELLRFASLAPPALRELAVARLAGLPGGDGLRAVLLQGLLAPHPGERVAAALALRRLPGGWSDAELQELLRRAVRDASPEVRDAAARALRDAGRAGLAAPLVAALGSESGLVRVHAAQALGTLGQAAAVPALVSRLATLPRGGGGGGWVAPRSSLFVGTQSAFVQGFDVDIAQNAAAGDPQVGVVQAGASLDVAVLGASGSGYATESAALRGALERLTGASPGSTAAAWSAWWEAHRARYEPGEPATGG